MAYSQHITYEYKVGSDKVPEYCKPPPPFFFARGFVLRDLLMVWNGYLINFV